MGRKPVIAGNWKMNKTTGEAVVLAQHISFETDKKYDDVDIILCPPFVDLKSVNGVIEFDNCDMMLGAQDVFWEESGAYTGAISPGMLKEVGCKYCIVGHSERREYFGDTDGAVNKKVKALIAHDITPILCCGEALDIRDAGTTLSFVAGQIRNALQDVAPADIAKMIIAYEPIWAIGAGRAATPEQAQEVCAHIRGVVAELAGNEAADAVRILYGGSMKPANVELFMPMPDVDGGLIGGAALDAKDFAYLVKAAHELK